MHVRAEVVNVILGWGIVDAELLETGVKVCLKFKGMVLIFYHD